MAERDCVKLEDTVNCSAEGLEKFRKVIYGAMFFKDRSERGRCVEHLNWNFNRTLRRGYYERGHIYLDVNHNGGVVNVDVGAVPKEYMDVGHYSFEI